MSIKYGLEITDAIIVGGYVKTGQLFYDGRPQGGKFNGSDDSELRGMAAEKKRRLEQSLGPEFKRLYPLAIWELRIWD